MAMGKPGYLPVNIRFNPTTKLGPKIWVVNSPTPKWDPSGFDPHIFFRATDGSQNGGLGTKGYLDRSWRVRTPNFGPTPPMNTVVHLGEQRRRLKPELV